MTAATHPDLTSLLADPERAHEVPLELIPVLLTQLAADHARLGALERVLLARLAVETNGHAPEEDRLLTAEQAAERLSTTKDWLRRHGARLPFVVRLSDGQIRYSTKGIERFITTRMGR